MPGSKALSQRQNAIAREYVRALLKDRFQGNQTACAAALGLAQPTLYNFLDSERGLGPKMLAGIAKLDPSAAASILAARAATPPGVSGEVEASGAPRAQVPRPDEAPSGYVRQDGAIEVLVRRGVGLRVAQRAIGGVRRFIGAEQGPPLTADELADLGQSLVDADEKRKQQRARTAVPAPEEPPFRAYIPARSEATLDVKSEARQLTQRGGERRRRKNTG